MSIRYFNTKALVNDIVEDRVGEKESFLYFLANTVIWTILLYYSILMGARFDLLYAIELIVVVLISVVGLIKAFEINGGNDGKNFLLRVNSLIFPLTIKISGLSIVLSWISIYIMPKIFTYESFRNPEKAYDLFLFLWAPIFSFLFYWRLKVHFMDISKRISANE